jgi:hypothetical protein
VPFAPGGVSSARCTGTNVHLPSGPAAWIAPISAGVMARRQTVGSSSVPVKKNGSPMPDLDPSRNNVLVASFIGRPCDGTAAINAPSM